MEGCYMKQKVNSEETTDDNSADFEMDRLDQQIILLVSFLALFFAIVGFSMSDVFGILIRS